MIDYEHRRAEGRAAAMRAYDEGNGVAALRMLVDYSVALEEHISQQNERIDELEEVLREARPLIVHNYEGSQGLIGDASRVVGLIDAALSREPPEQEVEDG